MKRPERRHRRLMTAGGCLLLSGQLLMAAPDDQTPRTVTLDEAVASADRAPELAAAQAGEQAAEAGVHVARAFPDPELTFQTNSINAQQAVSVLMPLPWPARGPRIEAATADLQTAGRARDVALSSVRQALRAAWFGLAAAEDRARAAADREARAGRNAAAISALLAEGRVARLEEVRANAEVALAQSDHATFDEALRTAGARLATLMGLESGTAITTGGSRPLPESIGTLEETVAQAREASPDVRLQVAAADAAAARYALARRLRVPGFGLNAGAEFNDPTQEGTNTFVGVSLVIPLAGPANAAAAALGQRDQQAALADLGRREAVLTAETAWGKARAARLRYEAMDGQVLPAARQTAEMTRVAFEEGKVDVFRLLEAERLLADAAVERADAYEAWGAANADLLRATAREGP
ncbi:MAG TPA: TolC family protein [Patescibacteria group bacterium]|nr:TolC family protein [Patescibacteria group bacterium]